MFIVSGLPEQVLPHKIHIFNSIYPECVDKVCYDENTS